MRQSLTSGLLVAAAVCFGRMELCSSGKAASAAALQIDRGAVFGARSVVQVHPGPPFISSRLPGVVPKTSIHNRTHTSLISLHQLRSHSQRRKIFPLCRQGFIAVFLRIQIERRLNLSTELSQPVVLSEWSRQWREFASDILEEEPLVERFRHSRFIAWLSEHSSHLNNQAAHVKKRAIRYGSGADDIRWVARRSGLPRLLLQ